MNVRQKQIFEFFGEMDGFAVVRGGSFQGTVRAVFREENQAVKWAEGKSNHRVLPVKITAVEE